MCKYPLFLSRLLRETPVCDCPESHAEIEKVFYRFRETVDEVNKATGDPITRNRIERTWLLQDRLFFPDQLTQIKDEDFRSVMLRRMIAHPPLSHASSFRLLGHVVLCGVLHVTWQGLDTIHGRYLVCILFKSVLVLAGPSRGSSTLHVLAAIRLANVKINEASTSGGEFSAFKLRYFRELISGPGLECHNALFTWKMEFEMEDCIFQLLFSACTAQEEEAWRSRIHNRVLAETIDGFQGEQGYLDHLAMLAMDIKPLACIFGRPGSFARRVSVHRATIGTTHAGAQVVIIRNTHTLRPQQENDRPAQSLRRSQSLLLRNNLPVLAPRRSERARLESQIADVWSRDVLPYPGISPRRGENILRTSAGSVMRKLSMASLTRKTSGSPNSLVFAKADDMVKVKQERKENENLESPSAQSCSNSSLRIREEKSPQPLSPLTSTWSEGSRGRIKLARSKSTRSPRSRLTQKSSKMNPFHQSNRLTSIEMNQSENIDLNTKRWSSPASIVRHWSSEGMRRLFP